MKRIAVLCLCLLVAGACEPTALPGQGAPKVPPGATTVNPPLPRGAIAPTMEIASRTLARPGVTVAELANGMTVIISENHNAPVVCVEAFVRTGSLVEGKYLGCGISHLAEHLVAKGAVHDMGPGAAAAKEAKQTVDRVDEIGGQSNAFTSQDKTAYYIAATSSKTDACIDLIADWMARPDIARDDFEREHQVVQRELEMGKDNPGREMWQAHARNFYGQHPAGVPVIGHAAPLAGLKYEDVLDYHRSRYVPQNMVFAVVGDVDTEKVLERVRKAMAGFNRRATPEPVLPEVAPVAQTRRVAVVHASATEASENLSFLTIPLVHPDLYALDVLSDILSSGESSRLVRAIQREAKLVTAIGSSSWTPEWGKGEFTVSFRGKPEQIDAAEKAVLDQLRQVVAEGVLSQELARAKRQKVADWVYSQQTVESQCATLGGDFLSTGDVGFSRTYTDRIQKVTAEQVQAAAKQYFDFDAMVVTRMLPPGPAAAAAATQGSQAGKTKTFTLDNGLRVVLHASTAVDLVSATLATEGGLLVETPQTNGMGTLMVGLSDKGAGSRSAEEIAKFFDSAGGSIGGACGNNTFYWQTTVLSDSFEQALPIFADVVLRPTYPKKELDIFQPVLLAQIKRIDETWSGLLNRRFRTDFYRDSPLAMQTAGDAAVVGKATPETIAAWHADHVKAGASVLAIYGHFDLDKTEAAVRKLFAAMAKGTNHLPAVEARKVAADGETYVHPGTGTGTGIIVAVPGMKVTNLDDRLPMTVLDTIISGYQLPRGWLHEELRGKGLVYVIHAYNAPALIPGAIVTYAHCEPPKAAEVVEIIQMNLRKTLDHAYTQAEVDEAVNIVLTADLLDAQTMGELAMLAALDELYGFGWDFRKKYEKLLRAVTPEDVGAVAKKYFSGGVVTTVVAPNPAEFKAPAGNGEKK